jgi:enterochelin esterase-like enzyme
MAAFATMWRSISVAQTTDRKSPTEGTVSLVRVTSPAMGEQRRLTLYKPPGWREGVSYPVIYAADGQYLFQFLQLLDPMIVKGEAPPLVAVGMWSAEGQGGPATRSQEYLPGFGAPRRYANFQHYFLGEVVPFAGLQLGASTRREDRMLFGYSDGAAWALTTGLKNPELFGAVTALSVGWEAAGEHIGVAGRPRLYIGIGARETDLKTVTTGIVRRAQRTPGEVVFRTGEGGHDPGTWRPMFVEAVKWAFARKQNGSDGL